MSEYELEPDDLDFEPVEDDYLGADVNDDYIDEEPVPYEAGAQWRAEAGAQQVHEQARLAAEATEAIKNAQHQSNRMGSADEVAEAVNEAMIEAASEALAQGFTPEQIQQSFQHPEVAEQILGDGIEQVHWAHLGERMRQQVRGNRGIR